MKAILLVAVGGAGGALLRWFFAGGIDRLVGSTGDGAGARFPWGILGVNLLGCLAIGVLYGFAETRDWLTDATRWLLLVGFLGSFTTFSTLGWNSFDLMRHGHFAIALANLLVSMVLGLLFVWGGYALAR